MSKKIKYQLPAWIFGIVIFIGSSIPSLSPPGIGLSWEDKIAHFIEFAVFGLLMSRSLRYSANSSLQRNYLKYAIIFSILYGAFDEAHQYFVPGRYSDLGDIFADCLGAAVGAGIYYFKTTFGFVRLGLWFNKLR